MKPSIPGNNRFGAANHSGLLAIFAPELLQHKDISFRAHFFEDFGPNRYADLTQVGFAQEQHIVIGNVKLNGGSGAITIQKVIYAAQLNNTYFSDGYYKIAPHKSRY